MSAEMSGMVRNLDVFRALLWKSYRVQRPVILFGCVLLLLPYVFGVAGILFGHFEWRSGWWAVLTSMALGSLALTLLTMTGLAGGAFATEREDGSSELLACLPVSRRFNLAAKALLLSTVVLGMWLFNLIPLAGIYWWQPPAPGSAALQTLVGSLRSMATIGVLLFGAAWFASAWMRRPTLASACGLAAPVLLAVAMRGLELSRLSDLVSLQASYEALAVTLGAVSFVAGCAVYLIRFDP